MTPKWVIGYKEGARASWPRAPRNNVLNSEGNEHHYSYDGLWKDGKPHGGGRYKFADGCLYVGVLGRENLTPAKGKAQYPGGTV